MAYPLTSVTLVGEYLMGLPQQLDVLTAQADGAEDPAAASLAEEELSQMAASWLDRCAPVAGLLPLFAAYVMVSPARRVAHMASEMYLGELQRIPALSPAGCLQLSADLEYYTNVLAALGVEAPPLLQGMLPLLRVPAEEWGPKSRELVEQGLVEAAAVDLVAKARKLQA